MASSAATPSVPERPSIGAMVAHEMMGSLGAILHWATVPPAFSTEEIAQRLDLIRVAALHLQALTSDLIDGDLARINVGAVDLREVLAFVRDVHAPLLVAGNVTMVTECDDEIPERIVTDATRLRQVLINLVSNALKVSATGTIRVCYTRDAEDLILSVIDQGPGLPADFTIQPFGRVRSHENGLNQEGHGLGLWICQNSLRALGGTALFRPGPDGIGTQVDVRLPFKAAAPRPPTDTPISEKRTSAGLPHPKDRTQEQDGSSVLAGRLALVIDDSAINRALMEALLSSFEMQVHCVTTRSEAIAAVMRRCPDVIVTDEMLVDDHGVDVIAHIKQLLGANCPPAVLVSAWDGVAEGFAARVTKPFNARTLYEALTVAIEDVPLN